MVRKKSIHFLTVTLFAGVLFSFLLYISAAMIMDASSDSELDFNRRFHTEDRFSDGIRQINYRIFRYIDNDNIVVGRDGWIFEVKDSDSGYERLLDYIGGCPFSDETVENIALGISDKCEGYAEQGINYVLMVVPDSSAVCSQQMPWYIGKRSEQTRLSQVSSYMQANNLRGLLDPSEIMINESRDTPMYNNTENSINAYGAYCIYNSVVARYLAETGREVDRIYRQDTEFYTRLTEGRDIARSVGLSEILKNKTVSLTDNMPNDYELTYNEKGLMITRRQSKSTADPLSVTVECADSWNRAQLMPYFSSTFDTVYYKDTLSEDADLQNTYGSTLIIQIINEGELEKLKK